MKTLVGVLFALVVVIVMVLVWALATLTKRTTHVNERVNMVLESIEVETPAPEPPSLDPVRVEEPEPVQKPHERNFAEFWADLSDYGARGGSVFTFAEAKALYDISLGRPVGQHRREEGQP